MLGPWVLRDILVVTTMSSGESQTCFPLQSWSVFGIHGISGFLRLLTWDLRSWMIPRVVSMGVRKMTCNMSQRHPRMQLVVLWHVMNKKMRWVGMGMEHQIRDYRWSKRRQVGKLQVIAGRVQQKWHCLRGIWQFDMKVDRCYQKKWEDSDIQRVTHTAENCSRSVLSGGFKSSMLSVWDGCPYAARVCSSQCHVTLYSTKTSCFTICCTACLHL